MFLWCKTIIDFYLQLLVNNCRTYFSVTKRSQVVDRELTIIYNREN